MLSCLCYNFLLLIFNKKANNPLIFELPQDVLLTFIVARFMYLKVYEKCKLDIHAVNDIRQDI